MRLLGFIVAGSVGLALLQGAAKALVLVAIVAALLTFARRPGETIGCMLSLGLLGLVGQYPLAALFILGGFLALGLICRGSNPL